VTAPPARLIDYGSVVCVILFEKRLPLTQTELAGSPEYIISLSNECLLPIDERGWGRGVRTLCGG